MLINEGTSTEVNDILILKLCKRLTWIEHRHLDKQIKDRSKYANLYLFSNKLREIYYVVSYT